MKATGIVRRIDELGRVVIPKEIRKTLRLREGDPLEFFTDKSELLLKKYSPIGSLENFAEDVCVTLNSATGKTVIITDTDNIIYAKGSGSREFEKKPISLEMERILSARKSVVNNVNDGAKTVKIVEDESFEYSGQLVIPIISSGDAIGILILISREASGRINQSDIKLAEFVCDFLSKQFE